VFLRSSLLTLFIKMQYFTCKACFDYRFIWRLLRENSRQDLLDREPQLSLVSNNIFLSCGVLLNKNVVLLDLIPLCFQVIKLDHFGCKTMSFGNRILYGNC
jgi:hypothetical protein